MTQRVLLLGPDADARRDMHLLLDRRGLEVAAIADVEAAKKVEHDVVIANAELAKAIAGNGGAPVIAIVESREVATAMQLLEAGVADIVTSPVDELALALALRHVALHPRRNGHTHAAPSLIGDGPAMTKLKHTIRTVAQTRSTVLVLGESGSGKELVARAIHDASPRSHRKFVAINCAAIPESLLESELFGHVKGAFTDAVRDKTGLFEDADGGTLFLDEVGELPLPLQSKLLRVLQDSEIRRVGDSIPIKVDVRLIAATLHDLAAAVAEGRFREDLFYRLDVLPVRVPPLRERTEDIPQLVRCFAERVAARHGREVAVPDPVIEALAQQPWPGNVRELENVIERALVLAESPAIDLPFLTTVMRLQPPTAAPEPDDRELSIKKATRSLERDLIRRALGVTHGNRTNAAKLLEISHRALLYKMKEYGIS